MKRSPFSSISGYRSRVFEWKDLPNPRPLHLYSLGWVVTLDLVYRGGLSDSHQQRAFLKQDPELPSNPRGSPTVSGPGTRGAPLRLPLVPTYQLSRRRSSTEYPLQKGLNTLRSLMALRASDFSRLGAPGHMQEAPTRLLSRTT